MNKNVYKSGLMTERGERTLNNKEEHDTLIQRPGENEQGNSISS